MDDLHFTDEAVTGLFIESTLLIIIPVILFIVWKIKTHEKVLPVIIGALTWLLFAIILKLAPGDLLLYGDNPIAKTISGNIWYTMIIAGVLAGVFEETGRFIAFKTVLKKREHRRVSISYGIGHGGFESIYIGVQMLTIPLMGIMINNGMSDRITAGMDEAMKATALAQLEGYASLTMPECLFGVLERIPAITYHISASVLVFAAAREKKYVYLYPLMILVHALIDFSSVFAQIGMNSTWGFELMLAVFAAAMAYFAARVYKRLN